MKKTAQKTIVDTMASWNVAMEDIQKLIDAWADKEPAPWLGGKVANSKLDKE